MSEKEYIFAWQEIYTDGSQNPLPETNRFSSKNDELAKIEVAESLLSKSRNAYHLWVHGFEAINLPSYHFVALARVIKDVKGRWKKSELLDKADIPQIIEEMSKKRVFA